MSAQPPSDLSDRDQTVRRLLEAMSPGLATELVRMLEEHRDMLLAEADLRLKQAIADRESELRTLSAAEQARARAETADQVRKDVTREMQAQFEQQLSKELRALKERLDQASAQAQEVWAREKSDLEAEAVRWHVLADFYLRTSAAISQTDILRRFLKAGAHYSSGIVLYLNDPDGLRRWGTEGEGSPFPELVSEDTRDPEWYWAPIVIRDRMVVAVGATDVRDQEALHALVAALKRAIENLGLRLAVRAGELPRPAATGSGSHVGESTL